MSIFLNQISDPDYKPTVEACHIKKYDILKCIEQIRAKERRLGRERGAGKRPAMIMRRNETKQEETEIQDKNPEPVALNDYKNEN